MYSIKVSMSKYTGTWYFSEGPLCAADAQIREPRFEHVSENGASVL